MSREFLTVGGTPFDGKAAPKPSQVLPSVEKIKSIERSLGGKLHVDISATKRRLEVIFDLLGSTDFNAVRELLDTDNAAGHKVRYFDDKGLSQDARFHFDDITYEPWIVGDDIRWRNVNVILLEV